MYESEENGEVLEQELAAILEIMLGVEEVELSMLFLDLEGPDTDKITYGETHFLFVTAVIINATAFSNISAKNVKLIAIPWYK